MYLPHAQPTRLVDQLGAQTVYPTVDGLRESRSRRSGLGVGYRLVLNSSRFGVPAGLLAITPVVALLMMKFTMVADDTSPLSPLYSAVTPVDRRGRRRQHRPAHRDHVRGVAPADGPRRGHRHDHRGRAAGERGGPYGLPASALDGYRSARPGASPGDLLSAVATDWFFRVPAIRLAEARAGSPAGTSVYEFSWRSSAFDGRPGACHGAEIAFAFDPLRQPENGARLGTSPPQALADEMHRAWVSFSTTGDPGWPRYGLDRRSVRRFGPPSETVEDPAGAERRLWDGIR